jgi:hypothetical protein
MNLALVLILNGTYVAILHSHSFVCYRCLPPSLHAEAFRDAKSLASRIALLTDLTAFIQHLLRWLETYWYDVALDLLAYIPSPSMDPSALGENE